VPGLARVEGGGNRSLTPAPGSAWMVARLHDWPVEMSRSPWGATHPAGGLRGFGLGGLASQMWGVSTRQELAFTFLTPAWPSL